jgi:hypothetical protein
MEPNQLFNLHNYAIQNYNQFSAILTWGQDILDNCPNAVFHPMGISWLDKEYVNNVDNIQKRFEVSFLCGGKTRLALLRSMMDTCKDNNIDIIVLTNNINCRLISNECIVLFNALIGKIPESSKSEIRIICASDTDPRFDKVKAIRTKCHFVDTVKSVSGGGKIKKNKAKSKKNKVKSKKNKAKSKKIK